MKRVISVVFAMAMAFTKTGYAQTVDCNYVFTNLERAICSNPELDELDKELESLMNAAINENTLTTEAVREMRNQLALRCGASQNVVACLIKQERKAISTLSLLSGGIVEIAASHRPEGAVGTNYKLLKSRLVSAEKMYRASGRVQGLVAATLELLDTYRSDDARQLPADVHQYEVLALESRVGRGCGNLREQRHWQRALQGQGRTCADWLRADRLD